MRSRQTHVDGAPADPLFCRNVECACRGFCASQIRSGHCRCRFPLPFLGNVSRLRSGPCSISPTIPLAPPCSAFPFPHPTTPFPIIDFPISPPKRRTVSTIRVLFSLITSRTWFIPTKRRISTKAWRLHILSDRQSKCQAVARSHTLHIAREGSGPICTSIPHRVCGNPIGMCTPFLLVIQRQPMPFAAACARPYSSAHDSILTVALHTADSRFTMPSTHV